MLFLWPLIYKGRTKAADNKRAPRSRKLRIVEQQEQEEEEVQETIAARAKNATKLKSDAIASDTSSHKI